MKTIENLLPEQMKNDLQKVLNRLSEMEKENDEAQKIVKRQIKNLQDSQKELKRQFNK